MIRRYRQKSFGRLDAAKGWISVGRALKVRSMGVTLASFPRGKGYDHPHSHALQEEIYLLLAGRGEMAVDGRLLRLRPGDAVLVQPAARRALRSGPRTGSTWLMVGAAPGAYRENDWTEHEEPAFPLVRRTARRRKARPARPSARRRAATRGRR